MRGNYSAVLKVIEWQQKQVFLVLLLFKKQGRREGGLFKGGTFSTLSYMNMLLHCKVSKPIIQEYHTCL